MLVFRDFDSIHGQEATGIDIAPPQLKRQSQHLPRDRIVAFLWASLAFGVLGGWSVRVGLCSFGLPILLSRCVPNFWPMHAQMYEHGSNDKGPAHIQKTHYRTMTTWNYCECRLQVSSCEKNGLKYSW